MTRRARSCWLGIARMISSTNSARAISASGVRLRPSTSPVRVFGICIHEAHDGAAVNVLAFQGGSQFPAQWPRPDNENVAPASLLGGCEGGGPALPASSHIDPGPKRAQASVRGQASGLQLLCRHQPGRSWDVSALGIEWRGRKHFRPAPVRILRSSLRGTAECIRSRSPGSFDCSPPERLPAHRGNRREFALAARLAETRRRKEASAPAGGADRQSAGKVLDSHRRVHFTKPITPSVRNTLLRAKGRRRVQVNEHVSREQGREWFFAGRSSGVFHATGGETSRYLCFATGRQFWSRGDTGSGLQTMWLPGRKSLAQGLGKRSVGVGCHGTSVWVGRSSARRVPIVFCSRLCTTMNAFFRKPRNNLRALQPAVNSFRDGKCSFAQDRSQEPRVRGLQHLDGPLGRRPPGRIRFQHQHDSVAEIAEQRGVAA